MIKNVLTLLRLVAIVVLLLIVFTADAAVWQWSVLVRNAKENAGQARAYLWIPPNCRQIKAVVFAQNNMEEQSILENAAFREELGKLDIAEVWVSPAYDLKFVFTEGAGETFNGIMADLAATSGYAELNTQPIIPMGHSAAASAPYYFAAWAPQRTLACLSVSGQWPYFRQPAFAPDIWGERDINFVPCLETMGEYESANNWSTEGLKERAEHPLLPLSMLACPAEFHFAASQRKIDYIALYIKKAIQYRLPAHTPTGKQPALIRIDPTKTGWLVDKWRFNQVPTAQPAPMRNYKGDPAQAFWFFDEELAKATAAYEARYRNKKTELIGFMQQGSMVVQRNVHQQFNLKFEPMADGITFKIHTAFYDTVPGGSPRPAGWAQLKTGERIGHALTPMPIQVDRITGPMVKLNDSTFRVHPQMGFWQFPHSYELWFSASHPGDEEYKPAVQQALMIIPVKNTAGKEQHITFLAIPNQKAGAKQIKLRATSDAGVPVGFYIQDGPAEIDGDNINLTAIPPRSHYPVRVTVVAWQYGNSNEPKLRTAAQVERVFWISK